MIHPSSKNCTLQQKAIRRSIRSRLIASSVALLVLLIAIATSPQALAQLGGGGGGGGGMGGGGGGAPAGPTKAKFRDHIHAHEGIGLRREKGDAVVLGVKISGNKLVSQHEMLQNIQTRKDRFYDYETVLGDVRRLNDMGSFDHVTFKVKDYPEQGGVVIGFFVHERAIIQRVVFHGNRGLNERELSGRAGLGANDPLSEFTIESARRRMVDYYKEKGFNQASITAVPNYKGQAGTVLFRINEGPMERIADIIVEGNTILSEGRLKKIIKSRGPTAGVLSYFGNTADMNKIDNDVNVLASTYHNLGHLTATVGRRIVYDETGKWITVTYVVNEGPRFKINNIQIIGNRFVTEASLRQRMNLKSGDMFDGTLMRRDVGELTYAYGELGFIYSEVKPQTIMRDEENVVDLVFKIEEGDRWKIGQIRVNIEGEPSLNARNNDVESR